MSRSGSRRCIGSTVRARLPKTSRAAADLAENGSRSVRTFARSSQTGRKSAERSNELQCSPSDDRDFGGKRFVKHAIERGVSTFGKHIRTDRITRPALAKTLRLFGSEGAKPFYRGVIAQSMLNTTNGIGGHLTESDLASYRVLERTPLVAEDSLHNYRDQSHSSFAFQNGPRNAHNAGFTIATVPPPSAGGILLLSTHFQRAPSVLGHVFSTDLRPRSPNSHSDRGFLKQHAHVWKR